MYNYNAIPGFFYACRQIQTMNMVCIEVFKTDVKKPTDADNLKSALIKKYPGSKVSFDLDDCDKVLRIEGTSIDTGLVIRLLQKNGFYCDELE